MCRVRSVAQIPRMDRLPGCCSMLQRVAVGRELLRVAVSCSVLQWWRPLGWLVFQGVAAWCGELQWDAVSCSAMQCRRFLGWLAFQGVAVCCSVLQCVAVSCRGGCVCLVRFSNLCLSYLAPCVWLLRNYVVYICCICMHTYLYMLYVLMYTNTNLYTYVHIHVYVCTYIHIYICTYTRR